MRDLDVFGIAPAAGHFILEPRILTLGHGDVRVDHEDKFAPLRSEALAAAALARLDDYRTALRGPRHGERPARAEKTPVVVEAMHLLRMSEQAGRLVLRNRVDLPAIPMPEHHLHEFVGPIIAQVVLDHLLAAHVLSLALVQRAPHLPTDPP